MDTAIKQLKEHIERDSEIVILSYGMGVESTAILLRWMLEPETCPCDLEKLIVITSQVGEEWPDTGKMVEEYMFPLMQEKGVRFVQVARKGHLQKKGYVVLEDSRAPQKCHIEGYYRLSEEQLNAGTVPQYAGEHRCALKFKNFVIESWLDEHVRKPARHVFGYNSEEMDRVEKSEAGFQKRLEKTVRERIAFGFNTDEMPRVKKAKLYDTSTKEDKYFYERVGFYPLLDWKWNRQDCIDYIKSKLQVIWKKSACVFCPFAHNKQNIQDLIERQKEYPVEVAKAMQMEYVSLAFNPRGALYSSKSLIDLVKETGNEAAVIRFNKILDNHQWAVYRVRRLYLKKGLTYRAVESREKTTRPMEGEPPMPLQNISKKIGATLNCPKDIYYAVVSEKNKGVYPTQEEMFVVAPAIVPDKARYGIDWFNRLWAGAFEEQMELFMETG
ncbi:hypothetical protein [Anaeromusa acidaminophila]|uniref:hypothetical protein n=1 Tax=Anaeromusa acidaminophila TaxID=81464 RepID=UPI00035EC524|nr:hypothetical protein [Anaeromusa acidaminophila]